MDRSDLGQERRRAPRRTVTIDEPLARGRLRTGGQLRLLEASSCGALVETTERMPPGRHLDIHVISVDGRVLVRACVSRAYVWTLSADLVQYRAALAFEKPLDIRAEGYAMPSALVGPERRMGSDYPIDGGVREIEFAEPLSA